MVKFHDEYIEGQYQAAIICVLLLYAIARKIIKMAVFLYVLA
jgi:hypothetical protein